MIKEMPRSETKKIRHPKGAKTQVKSKIVKKAKKYKGKDVLDAAGRKASAKAR